MRLDSLGDDNLIAVIMAGGKATRFRTSVEKALLTVGRLTLLERSLEALSVCELSEILVAISPHTPVTAAKAAELGMDIVETPGTGYHEDVARLLQTYNPFLTLNVDVPFVRKTHVRTVLEAFDGGSLAGVLPVSVVGNATMSGASAQGGHGARFLWIGLNIVTPNPETDTIELDDPLLAVNVNDEADLDNANRIAVERGI